MGALSAFDAPVSYEQTARPAVRRSRRRSRIMIAVAGIIMIATASIDLRIAYLLGVIAWVAFLVFCFSSADFRREIADDLAQQERLSGDW